MDELYPFQEEGAAWLTLRRHAILGDEMRLGKTPQCIRAADVLGLERVLVVCPAVARVNWLRAWAEWSFLSPRFQVLESKEDHPDPAHSAICSYEYATTHAKRLKCKWDLLILDELHFLKSVDAKRAKSVLGREGLVHQAARVWALSGTPAPNHPGELWTLLYTFGVTGLSYDAFVDRFCEVVDRGYGRTIIGAKRAAIPEYRELLKRVMLRRLIRDVTDLPPISFSEYAVEPGHIELEEEPSFAQFVGPAGSLDLEFTLLSERTTANRILKSPDEVKMLEALANGTPTLRRYSGLQKVEPIAAMVKGELETGLYDKVVIFAIHRAVVEQLAEKLAEFNPAVLYGSTTNKQAPQDKFKNDPTCKVFIGNIQTASTNISLAVADQIIFAEADYVPGNNAQAALRCTLITEKKNVSARFITLNNPIDEQLTRIVRRKTKELAEIFDS